MSDEASQPIADKVTASEHPQGVSAAESPTKGADTAAMDTADADAPPSVLSSEVEQPAEPVSNGPESAPPMPSTPVTQPPATAAPPTPAATKAAGHAATIPTRQYLDQTVVPILLQGLSALAKERPIDPIDYLAKFLVDNKARYTGQTSTGGGQASAVAGSDEVAALGL